jgi:hypothetical protein
MKTKALRIFGSVVILVLVLPMAIPWHELVGHALVAMLCGGNISQLQILGLEFRPRLAWKGLAGNLADCEFSGIPPGAPMEIVLMAGAVSTLVAAAVAVAVLWRWRPAWWARAALTGVGIWALDLATFILPSFGLRRYVWRGTNWSEPYDGAQMAGIPGPLFQAITMAACATVLAGLIYVSFFRPAPGKQPTESPRQPNSQ